MAEQLYPERIEIAYSRRTTFRASQRAGKLVAAIGIENGYLARPRISSCSTGTTTLGARYVGLVHDGDNDLARSARPNAAARRSPRSADRGVSALGAEAIARMNRLGHHGRRVARLEADGARRDAAVGGAGDRVALRCRERQRASAQHGRRDVARSESRRRRRANRRLRRVLEGAARGESGRAAGAAGERAA